MMKFKVDNLKNMNSEIKSFTEYLRLSGADDDDIFASKLISCELITNVIRHGGDEASFTGIFTAENIVITVAADSLKKVDFNAEMPDVFAESGRGLYIIKCFSNQIERGDSGEIKVTIKR